MHNGRASLGTTLKKAAVAKDAKPAHKHTEASQDCDADDSSKPWCTVVRPVWADPPKDNSFTLEDEGHATSVEALMCNTSVSDPLQQDNPLVFVSPAFERLSGYPSEELLGENCNILQRNKPDEEAVDAMRAAISARRFVAVQITNYRKDGRKFCNLVCLLPVLDSNNNLRHYLGVQCDIEKKEDKAAFAAKWTDQVKFYMRAFAVTDNTQEHAPVVAVNEGFTAITGYGQAEFRGCSLLALGGPDSSKSSLKKVLMAHRTDKPCGVRVLCYKRDGSPFWGYIWNCPLWERSLGNGQCKRHLVLVFDITTTKLKRMGKYMLGKVIGQGASGIVYKGLNTATDEVVAVKSVDASRFRSIAEIEQMQEEMNVSASLKHPNIVRLYEVHFNNNIFYLVMELSSGGSLMKYIHEREAPCFLDEQDTHRLFVQMVSALDYCHRKRIIHRDLKPENILMDADNNIKIADFGLAAISGFSSALTLQCGTPEFTAPEITTGKEYEGASIDIWSLGVILYEMLTGKLPFSGSTQALLFKSIQRGVYEPLPSSISAECRDLLGGMLTVEPSQRINMDDIVRHPWLRSESLSGAMECNPDINLACSSMTSTCASAAAAAALQGCGMQGDSISGMQESVLHPVLDSSPVTGGHRRSSYTSGHSNMHDSVRIVIPNGASVDDPIYAAMMRSQGVTQPSTAPDEEEPIASTTPTALGRSRGSLANSSINSSIRSSLSIRSSANGSVLGRAGPGGTGQDNGRMPDPTRHLRPDLLESRKAKSGTRSDTGAVRPTPRSMEATPTAVPKSARSDVGVQSTLRNGGAVQARKAALPPLSNLSTVSAVVGTDRLAKDLMSRGGRSSIAGGSDRNVPPSPGERASPARAKAGERRAPESAISAAASAASGGYPSTPPRNLPPLKRL